MLGDRKLDIGAGNSKLPGYETSDIRPGCDYQCDAMNISSLGKFDELYCNMMLEHLKPWQIPLALKDWYEALNLNGVLHVIVPDLEDILRLIYVDQTEALRRLFGGSLTKDGPDDCSEQEHRWAFNSASLSNYLLEAGFDGVKRKEAAVGLLYMIAWKT